MRTKRVIGWIVGFLIIAEVVIVLLSWLLSATMTTGVRPLLSSEGVRWFFSSYVAIIGAPWLVWLLLLSLAGGCMYQSGIFRHGSKPLGKLQGLGYVVAVIMLVIYVACILLLTVAPHAVLLSATGHLSASPFSRALVPVIAMGLIVCSLGYGIVTRAFTSIADVCASMTDGVRKAAPLFLIYVLLAQLVESLLFVF